MELEPVVTTVIPAKGRTYAVVAGDGCDHVPSQLLSYRSPGYEHKVWSCPRCHRIVIHDEPSVVRAWTPPIVEVPTGLEGVPLPGGGRGWAMPLVDPERGAPR